MVSEISFPSVGFKQHFRSEEIHSEPLHPRRRPEHDTPFSIFCPVKVHSLRNNCSHNTLQSTKKPAQRELFNIIFVVCY